MKASAILIAILLLTKAAMAITPFNLPWMNSEVTGTRYNSTERPNSVFVVEAYFLGCPYCNENAPKVNELAAKYSNNTRVEVLDVGIDRLDSQYATWISRHHPNHPVLKDDRMTLIGQLGTKYYPSTYVIDCHGNLISSHSGKWTQSDMTEIESEIDNALSTTCD